MLKSGALLFMNRTDEPSPSPSRSWRVHLDTAATVAVLVVSIVVTWGVVSGWMQSKPVTKKAAPAAAAAAPAIAVDSIRLGDGPIKGDKNAKVVLVEFSDFQCPYCARFAQDTLPALDQKYLQPGKVMFSFQHSPLRSHAFARRAAEGAECANRQGHFWEMHDALFAAQKKIDEAFLVDTARRVGLNTEIFAYCLDGEASPLVTEQAQTASGLGVTGTPTFFVGTVLPGGRVKPEKQLAGTQPLQKFEEALDEVLKTQMTERR